MVACAGPPMKSDDEYMLRPAGDADHAPLADLLSHAFGFPRDDAQGWFARPGTALRVYTTKRSSIEGGTALAGGLLEIPMGQFFGGRSVSTMGVAGVGIASELRGRGLGAKMMVAMLRDARSQRFALSSLYPATLSLYRRAGYERAGAHYAGSFDPRNFEVPRVPDVSITEIKNASSEGLPPDLRALYRSNAARATGHLDRGEYIWSRVTNPRGLLATKTFVASHHGKLEGYVVCSHQMGNDESKVTVTDLVATTKRAANAILRLLIEYRSLATVVKWKGDPSDLFTSILPERHYQFTVTDAFMIRVVNPSLAITTRGYPRFAAGTVTFDIDDASLPENSGSYVFTLEDGKAIEGSKPGGSRHGGLRVAMNERGLAALYSGFSSPHTLAAAGLLEADEDTLATLGVWFGGPPPSTPDFF